MNQGFVLDMRLNLSAMQVDQVDANLSFHEYEPVIKTQITTNMVSVFKLAIEKNSETD